MNEREKESHIEKVDRLHVENAARLLTDEAAAAFLTIPAGTLRNWRVSGLGPRFVRLGRSIRYRESDLRAFIEARVYDSTSRKVLAVKLGRQLIHG